MADNTQINPGTGGDILSTDDLGTYKVQRVKVQFGADGSASDVSTSNPLPSNITDGTSVAAIKAASTAAAATDPALVVAISPNNDVFVGGDTANDSADSGNPVKVGAKAINAWATAVANADRVDAIADLLGRQLVGFKPPELQKSFSATYTTAQTGTALWTPTAGKKCVVTSVTISTTSTTSGKITLWWGSSADTTYNEGTDQPLEAAYFVPSSAVSPGMTKIYTDPIVALNADYRLRVTTSTALNCVVTVHGYEI